MTERDPNETQPHMIGPDRAPPAGAVDATRPAEPHVEGVNGPVAPTTPVTPAAAQGGGARRWGIALVVVALVVGAAAAAAFLLAGSSTPSAILAYAPSDAVTYVSARLDLPGDQRQKVGDLLAKFPGFADPSTLDQKVGEVLDRIIAEATSGEQTYTADIEPWFGGEIGVAIGRLPDLPADGSGAIGDGGMLALVSVSDASAARAWFDDAVGNEPLSTESYSGVELVFVGRDGAGVMGIVGGDVMLLGDVASVKAAIDSNGQGGLSTNPQFVAAQAATTGDHLGSFYVDTGAYVEWVDRISATMPDALPGLGFAGMADLPAWTAGRLRAEGDALVIDVVAPTVDGTPERTNRASDLAPRVPASTVALVDIHDAGVALSSVIDSVRTDPETAQAFSEIESAVALVGGFDGLIGWIGDAGVAVTADGTDIGGGLVVSATDAAAAEQFTSMVEGLLLFGGSELGVSTRAEEYNGTTITFLDLSEALATSGGIDGDIPEIGWAVADDLFVLGVSESFIKSVLDTTPATSLAEHDRYRDLVGRAGRENVTSAWLDLVGLRRTIESFGAQELAGLGDYEQDLKPYLEPFDALVATSVSGGEFDRSTIIISVK